MAWQTTNINTLADEYLRIAYHGLRAPPLTLECLNYKSTAVLSL